MEYEIEITKRGNLILDGSLRGCPYYHQSRDCGVWCSLFRILENTIVEGFDTKIIHIKLCRTKYSCHKDKYKNNYVKGL